jgi:very-short-patch-repair endonuclease
MKRIRIAVNGKHKLLTPAQVLLAKHLRELGLHPEYEYRFNPDRKWLADIYLHESRILIECDGGKWHGGHKRGQALEDDYERQNWAQMARFRILRFTNEQVNSGWAKAWVDKYIKEKTE